MTRGGTVGCWGNAMRWLLTSEEFSVAEAHRIGLVQESPSRAATSVR
jgi:enoyl-CoA hydratase/carnithine racemase